MTDALPDDTRGIVDPATMLRHVDFARHPPGDDLDGVIAWFWSVAWDLPEGVTHDQPVLNHPAGNVSVGTLDDRGVPLDPPAGRLYGVLTGVSHRLLSVAGWTVAARTTVGGLGVLVDGPARATLDAELSLDHAIPGLDGPRTVATVATEPDNASRAAVLRHALTEALADRNPTLVAEAREVAATAERAEHDRTICRVAQLASDAGVSIRTLQRQFDQHVGVGPAFVIRRWRIIEAAEAARQATERGEPWRGWAAVAAELGYADQAHLTRDFRRHLGTSPSAYLNRTSGWP